jgi:hypothetical protein
MKFSILILILICQFLSAQPGVVKDTVETARQLSYEGNYKDAVQLLSTYETDNPNEINAVRLHAQILYWMEDYNAAFQLCESYLKDNPEEHYLVLDYIRMLFEQERYEKAKLLLSEYLKIDSSNVEANNMLGTIYYWQGNPETSLSYFHNVLIVFPANEWALGFVNQIRQATTTYLNIKSCYSDDTQPLKTIDTKLQAGWYSSNLLMPEVIIQEKFFNRDGSNNSSFQFSIGNKFSFSKILTDVFVSGGIYTTPGSKKANWIGKFGVTKKLLKYISSTASVSRNQYLYTLSSLQQTIIYENYSVALIYDEPGSWNGNAGFTHQNFADNNYIQSAYAWLLLPAIEFSIFKFKFGYAYNFSNSKENRFKPVKSLNELTAEFNTTSNIVGEYNPYFTPRNQNIHSVLGTISFNPVEMFSLTVNLNAGVFSRADTPYLYLDKITNEEIVIRTGYVSKKYIPLEIVGQININFSQNVFLELKYAYSRTIFYNSNSAQLGINYKFLNE